MKESKEIVKMLSAVDSEGLEYAFVNYSSFEEIKDERFHELRKEFLYAYRELDRYLNTIADKNEYVREQ